MYTNFKELHKAYGFEDGFEMPAYPEEICLAER